MVWTIGDRVNRAQACVRRAGNHHRTLTTDLNMLARCQFMLEAVKEPIATPLLARHRPLYEEVPIFFAARVRNS